MTATTNLVVCLSALGWVGFWLLGGLGCYFSGLNKFNKTEGGEE